MHINQSLLNKINKCIVWLKHGLKTGTGFFIGPGLIASCHHNLGDVTNAQLKIVWEGTELKIVKVHLSEDTTHLDLIIVEVNVDNHPVLPIKPPAIFNSEVYLYGYQYSKIDIEKGYRGYPTIGKTMGYADFEDKGKAQRFIVIEGANIMGGISGAPVFSFVEGAVIGVIKKNNRVGEGLAIPINRLEEILPTVIRQNQETASLIDTRDIKALSKYLNQISDENSHVRMINLQRELEIEDIYITLTLASQSITGFNLDTNDTTGVKKFGQKIERFDIHRDLGSPQKLFNQPEVGLQEVISQNKVIILGEPGSGKSTLLQHLVVKSSLRNYYPNRIPIFVRLGELELRPGCVRNYITQAYNYAATELENAVSNGEAVFFLDGLDEISKIGQGIVEREISRLAGLKNNIIVSCRSAAFPRGLFSSDFKVYECTGFNKAQQKRFIRKWFKGSLHQIKAVEKELYSNPGMFGFAKNPLLLSLTSILFENEPNLVLPKRRSDLYKKVSEVLFKRRIASPTYVNIPKAEKIKLLKSIAFRGFVEGTELYSEDKLLELIDEYTADSQKPNLVSRAADEVLEVLSEQDGILTIHKENTYRFLHLTFQEYFTALHISSLPNWYDIVNENKNNSRWEEVIKLCFSLVDRNKASELLHLIWNEGSINNPFYSQLFLAGRCTIEAKEVPEDYLLTLLEHLLRVSEEGDIQALIDESIMIVASICAHNPAAFTVIFNYFRKLLTESNGSYHIVSRYLTFLKFTGTDKALKELRTLTEMLLRSENDNERRILLLGTGIHAIGFFGLKEEEMTNELQLLLKLSQADRSHTAAMACIAVSNLLPASYKDKYVKLLSGQNQRIKLLAAYVLSKYEEEDLMSEIVTMAISQGDINVILLLNQSLNSHFHSIPNKNLHELFVQCNSVEGQALLVGISNPFWGYVEIYDIVFDNNRPLILRISCTELILRFFPTYLKGFLSELLKSDVTDDLKRMSLNIALEIGIRDFDEQLFEYFESSAINEKMIATFVRFLQKTSPIRASRDWLINLLDRYERFTSMHLNIVYALSYMHDKRVINILKQYVELDTKKNDLINEKIMVYKSLGHLGSDEAISLLCKYVFIESDPFVVSVIIELIGNQSGEHVEEILLKCVNVNQWPEIWPDQWSEVKPGEQRPSENRVLSSIRALNKINSVKCLPILEKILVDSSENTTHKEAAFDAIKDIKWNNGIKL